VQADCSQHLEWKVASDRVVPVIMFAHVRCFSTVRPALKILRSTVHDPWFNLATEEWILNHLNPSTQTLFLWRNAPTVVIGRNQNPWKECHVQNMEEDHVYLARRKSGGGAVYQDLGNTCFTFLSPQQSYSKSNNNTILLSALAASGVLGEASGRNDLIMSDTKRKFSGSAFRLTRDRAFHHGTLLINVDTSAMSKYLNPNKAKLLSKGVSSVQARVINLSEVNPSLSHTELCRQIEEEFCKFYDVPMSQVTKEDLQHATLADIEDLNACYQQMQDWNWRFGESPEFSHHMEHRFDWGIMDVHINAEGSRISGVQIFSDSLYPTLVDLLKAALPGVTYDRPGVLAACQATRRMLTSIHSGSVNIESNPELATVIITDQDAETMMSQIGDLEKWLMDAI
jgi:lipoate-protein ligase A